MALVLTFTGSRHPLKWAQFNSLFRAMEMMTVAEVHEGGCTGGDDTFYTYCLVIGHRPIHVYPASDVAPRWRAYHNVDIRHRPAPALKRNRRMIDRAVAAGPGRGLLIACPDGFKPRRRSGTWSTVRYARRCGLPVLFIFPDGSHRLIR